MSKYKTSKYNMSRNIHLRNKRKSFSQAVINRNRKRTVSEGVNWKLNPDKRMFYMTGLSLLLTVALLALSKIIFTDKFYLAISNRVILIGGMLQLLSILLLEVFEPIMGKN